MQPKIKLYADGAELKGMLELYEQHMVSGFTTNPTLMRKSGITDYKKFAKSVIKAIPDLPISFEVFSDDFYEMEREAREISSWGDNVYVKIPVTNSRGESTIPLIRDLRAIKLNITAILTTNQVNEVVNALSSYTPSIVSVFAGRIADTGVNPEDIMRNALTMIRKKKHCELLWASTRELYNIIQAEHCGCQIITVPNDILKKLPLLGKNLTELSLDTVRMFREDAIASGYKI